MSDDFDIGDLGDDPGADDLHWLDDLVDAWTDPHDEPVAAGDLAGDPGDDLADDPSEHLAGGADLGDGADGGDDAIDLDVDLDDGLDDDLDDDRNDDLDVDPDDAAAGGIDGDAGLAAGELSADVLHAALVDIGADAAAEAITALTDGGLEPRNAVTALDAAGIPARVEHADIGSLVESVALGGDVLLVGADTPYAVVSVDVAGGVVELEAGGARSTVSLQHLADAWADLDHEVVLLPEAGGGPVQLAGDSMLLAVDPTELPDATD